MDDAVSEVSPPLMVSGTQRLVTDILARYGSIDAFCARLRELLEETTDEFPVVSAGEPGPPDGGGRHRLRGA
ncbi:hypothetical protein AB0H76_11570 [Nocardia sp. NPDC050712]|uniref:hypothetical protein n=1 Tax=Nocardia sp. NPDC050712 TaxID=3155518 RepID=UPI0033FD60D7